MVVSCCARSSPQGQYNTSSLIYQHKAIDETSDELLTTGTLDNGSITCYAKADKMAGEVVTSIAAAKNSRGTITNTILDKIIFPARFMPIKGIGLPQKEIFLPVMCCQSPIVISLLRIFDRTNDRSIKLYFGRASCLNPTSI